MGHGDASTIATSTQSPCQDARSGYSYATLAGTGHGGRVRKRTSARSHHGAQLSQPPPWDVRVRAQTQLPQSPRKMRDVHTGTRCLAGMGRRDACTNATSVQSPCKDVICAYSYACTSATSAATVAQRMQLRYAITGMECEDAYTNATSTATMARSYDNRSYKGT